MIKILRQIINHEAMRNCQGKTITSYWGFSAKTINYSKFPIKKHSFFFRKKLFIIGNFQELEEKNYLTIENF